MAGIKSAMMQMRDKPVARPKGNIILRVAEIGDKTISGEVMTGPAKGQKIEVIPGGHLSIADYTKGKTEIDAGGYLRLERVGPKDGEPGVYTSRWCKTFQKEPDAGHDIKFDEVTYRTEMRRTDSNGNPQIFLNTLSIADEKIVKSTEEMEEVIAAGLASAGAVNLFMIEDGELVAINLALRVKRDENNELIKDGDTFVYEDPAERAKDMVERFKGSGDEALEGLQTNGMSIVPVTTYRLGSDTAKNIQIALDDARKAGKVANISTVNPEDFKPMTLGARVSLALATKKQGTNEPQIPREYAEDLKARFLASAPASAQAALTEQGWGAVSDDVLRAFFAKAGVKLMADSRFGYSTNTISLQEFTRKNPETKKREGTGSYFVNKSFRTSLVTPFPPLEFCKDLRQTYSNEVGDAILAVTQAPAADKAAKPENDAEAATEEASGMKAAAEQAEAAENAEQIDDLLDKIGAEGMDLD